jgi:exonuclease SbcD
VILAHLADLHLGFRAYERAEGGRNVRESDVSDAFLRAVDEVVRLRPDVVLIAGDVFDRPDPPPAALVTLTRGLETVRDALSGTPVLIVAGARDTPVRPGDPGVLAALDTLPGVAAASGAIRSARAGDLSVTMLSHRAALESLERPAPDASARWNVLLTHARAPAGSVTLPRARAARPARRSRNGGRSGGQNGGRSRAARVPERKRVVRAAPLPGAVDPAAWDYVALGGEHVQRSLLPHVRWPGSLERVGWRPWDEALEEKCFLTWDLEAGAARFHPVSVRAVVSLAPIRVPPGQPDRLRRRVREVTDEVPGGIDGKIVRVRVHGADPADLAGLAEQLLPSLRDRALHLSVALDDAGSRPAAPPGDPLHPRLAELLVEEGLAADEASARAGALLGEVPAEASAS